MFFAEFEKNYRLKYSAQTTVKNNRGFVRFLSDPDNPIPARRGSFLSTGINLRYAVKKMS